MFFFQCFLHPYFRGSGSGVLAVPYAFGLINYWAVLLLFVVVGLTAFTACLIGDQGWGRCWSGWERKGKHHIGSNLEDLGNSQKTCAWNSKKKHVRHMVPTCLFFKSTRSCVKCVGKNPWPLLSWDLSRNSIRPDVCRIDHRSISNQGLTEL